MCPKFIWVSAVLFVFVEAKLRASAKQMFSHAVAGYVSQTNSEMERSGIEVGVRVVSIGKTSQMQRFLVRV